MPRARQIRHSFLQLTSSGRLRLLVLSSFCVFALTGCAYFRFGDKTREDLKEEREQKKENNNYFFKPGTVFYSE